MNRRVSNLWGAHASRVLVGASRPDELSLRLELELCYQAFGKVRFGETPKPTRETRMLPG
jgi:hypothetical protein